MSLECELLRSEGLVDSRDGEKRVSYAQFLIRLCERYRAVNGNPTPLTGHAVCYKGGRLHSTLLELQLLRRPLHY